MQDVGWRIMMKRIWSTIGATTGGLLVLGALVGLFNLVRATRWMAEDFPEQSLQMILHGGIICALQLTVGTFLLWFSIRGVKRTPAQMETADNAPRANFRKSKGSLRATGCRRQ
jgi:hypothetical protein